MSFAPGKLAVLALVGQVLALNLGV
jgi:hypothetical protein